LGITVYNCLFTYGLSLVEASRAALIVPTNPAFTALFAGLWLREPLGRTRAAGILLSVLGALWVLGRGSFQTLAHLDMGAGELVLVASLFMWSAYTLPRRIAVSSLSPLALTAYVMAFGSLPLAIPAWLEHAPLPHVTPQGRGTRSSLTVFGAQRA